MKGLHRSIVTALDHPNVGILVLRIALATIFISHGWMKLQAMPQVVGFFGSLGFSPALAYFVALVEFLGGIGILLGSCVTRYISALLAIIMAVAIYSVHFKNGFGVTSGGYEFVLVLMLGSLALVFLGEGKIAVSRFWSSTSENLRSSM